MNTIEVHKMKNKKIMSSKTEVILVILTIISIWVLVFIFSFVIAYFNGYNNGIKDAQYKVIKNIK